MIKWILQEKAKKKNTARNYRNKKVMDFDSPDQDVEKEFPGLFASESTANRKKDDEDCKFHQIILLLIERKKILLQQYVLF